MFVSTYGLFRPKDQEALKHRFIIFITSKAHMHREVGVVGLRAISKGYLLVLFVLVLGFTPVCNMQHPGMADA